MERRRCLQAFRLCRHHHCRNRTTTSYSQRPIHLRILTPQRPSCARYLERCPRCIDQSFSKNLIQPIGNICTRAGSRTRHQEEGGWDQILVRLWSDPHYKSQYFGRKDTKSGEKGTVTEKAKNRRNLLKGLALPGKIWRRGSESNRRIKVLQTSPLPLGYRAPGQRKPTGNPTSGGVKITASVFALGMTTGSVLIGAGDGT
jgi:hypothetical protein